MKKILSMIMACICLSAACFSWTGCWDQPTSSSDEQVPTLTDEEIYDKIYAGDATVKYAELQGADRYLASFGYVDNQEQGYNHWYYMSGNAGNLSAMEYDTEKNRWVGGNSQMQRSVITVEDSSAGFVFSAPEAGKVTISGNVRMEEVSSTPMQIAIYNNERKIYPTEGEYLTLQGDDKIGWFIQLDEEVEKGDKIYFRIKGNGKVYFNPCVDYTNTLDETLYKTPSWGYYGDIHVYYHEDIINIYLLRLIPEPLQWVWYLYQSTDMFRSEEAPVYTEDFVENHYMAYAKTENVVDYVNYPDGARDTTKFYDPDCDRYRFIGLMYKDSTLGRMNCDLAMRSSATKAGDYVWEEYAVPLRQYPNNSGEPEVAGFRKINDRWYLYASIGHTENTHFGGPLSYWMSEKNQTIDNTDWLTAETHLLDGGDLLGAQIENIAGKYYLYGKLPRCYYSSEYGGYNNLPREVYQRENGLLGTKLDSRATKLVNKGKLIDMATAQWNVVSGSVDVAQNKLTMRGKQDNRAEIDTQVGSSFITYDLKMGSATEAGFVMNDGNRDFKVVIKEENGKMYLQAESPNDPHHVLNSKLYFGDASQREFQVKLVVEKAKEGSIYEFYVNDTLTLTARTGMGKYYKPSFYANGDAEFTNFSVNRLAQYYDIYE